METTIVYFILISSLSFVLIQALVSMNYFKRFAFEYLSNEPISWNPNHDRSASVFSLIFGLFSFYLMREIWHGGIEDSLFLTIIYLMLISMFTFFMIVFIRQINKVNLRSEVSKKKIENHIFLHDIENNVEDIFEFLMQVEFFDKKTSKVDFRKLLLNEKLENRIICTAKAGNNYSYVPLLVLYKVIIRDGQFTFEFIKKEFATKFLFRKNDPNTGNTEICEVNIESLKKAFKKIDSGIGIQNHKDLINDLKNKLN